MIYIENSQTFKVAGLLLQSSDGAPLTGITPSATISKNGNAFAAATNTPVEIGNGWYSLDITDNETSTDGPLIVHLDHASAADTYRDIYFVGTAPANLLQSERDAVAISVLKMPLATAHASSVGGVTQQRTPLNALRSDVNRKRVNGTTEEVYEEDDATIAYTVEIVATHPTTSLVTEKDPT